MSEPRKLPAVYAGLRPGKGGLLVECWHAVEEGGLSKPRYFKASSRRRVLGGLYDGILFSEDGAVGINTARYTGEQWGKEHAEQVIQWEAEDAHARHLKSCETLERDAKKQTLIDEALSELRVLYAGMRKRGDYMGMAGLEAAILESLRSAR